MIQRTLAASRGSIRLAAEMMSEAVVGGGKLLLCGNGGSAADAQHFAAEIVGRFLRERRAIAALALTTNTSVLTAVANDTGFDRVFARQVEAFGCPGDVLVCISTSGKSPNVTAAAAKARERGLRVISLTGADATELSASSDVVITVPSRETPRVQEAHTVVCHTLCRILEQVLFG